MNVWYKCVSLSLGKMSKQNKRVQHKGACVVVQQSACWRYSLLLINSSTQIYQHVRHSCFVRQLWATSHVRSWRCRSADDGGVDATVSNIHLLQIESLDKVAGADVHLRWVQHDVTLLHLHDVVAVAGDDAHELQEMKSCNVGRHTWHEHPVTLRFVSRWHVMMIERGRNLLRCGAL
jgi:hypothetical protein